MGQMTNELIKSDSKYRNRDFIAFLPPIGQPSVENCERLFQRSSPGSCQGCPRRRNKLIVFWGGVFHTSQWNFSEGFYGGLYKISWVKLLGGGSIQYRLRLVTRWVFLDYLFLHRHALVMQGSPRLLGTSATTMTTMPTVTTICEFLMNSFYAFLHLLLVVLLLLPTYYYCYYCYWSLSLLLLFTCYCYSTRAWTLSLFLVFPCFFFTPNVLFFWFRFLSGGDISKQHHLSVI